MAALEVILSDYSYVGGYAPSAQDNKVGGTSFCHVLCYAMYVFVLLFLLNISYLLYFFSSY